MSETNNKIQERVEAIKEKFENRVEAIRKNGAEKIKTINEDAPDPSNTEAALNFTFDVKYRITSIKFDVPKFSMEREVIKFDIPEVRMETEEIKFDVPATRMKRKCVAKKPEFHGFKVKWKCIYMHVPEVYKKRITIKTDIPKFTSKRVEITFDKPVVKMDTIEVKMHLPQFYLKKVDVQIDEHKNEIEDVATDMTSEIAVLQNEMKRSLTEEISEEIDLMFDTLREDILKEREAISANYDKAIMETKSAIKRLKENNATAKVKNLEEKLSQLVSEYKLVLTDLDKALEGLNQQEEESIRSLKISA
ncbi:MAG: hypothetical protein GQ574_06135 [Crocinitomix sp.]|nr:hypothetical protein [Crocinitomix sp.]